MNKLDNLEERFDKPKKKRKSPPPFTAEHRKHMSDGQKKIGNVPPSWKGKKRSEETRKKMSIAQKGRKRTPEQNEKNRQARLRNPNRYWLDKKRPDMTGNKHFAWKDGATPKNQQIRTSLEYKIWRRSVFERDNYTCVWCGIRGGVLNADHIKPFAYFPELRFAIDNGRTLCVRCHRTTDTYGNRYKN